jgi:sirohydrochlorin cobaltochelatase
MDEESSIISSFTEQEVAPQLVALGMPTDSSVLIVAHGSRDQAARMEFVEQARAIAAELPDIRVEHAVLEFPGDHAPSIGDAVDALAPTAKRLVVLPLFLFDAGHVRRDVPAELAAARERSPHLEINILPQVGEDDGLLEVLADRARGARRASNGDWPWAVVVVGAGTSSSGANAELARMAEQLRGQVATPIIEPAFVSLADPTVAEAIARSVERGAREVVTIHYFLNTGVLARRIESQARAEAQRLGVQVTVGEHFGTHEVLTQSLATRIRLAVTGNAEMRHKEQPQD